MTCHCRAGLNIPVTGLRICWLNTKCHQMTRQRLSPGRLDAPVKTVNILNQVIRRQDQQHNRLALCCRLLSKQGTQCQCRRRIATLRLQQQHGILCALNTVVCQLPQLFCGQKTMLFVTDNDGR